MKLHKVNQTSPILIIQIAKEEILIKQKLNTISSYEKKLNEQTK
jgi:hypothetical protein